MLDTEADSSLSDIADLSTIADETHVAEGLSDWTT